MHSAVSVATGRSAAADTPASALPSIVTVGGLASLLALSSRAYGAYEVSVWAPLGVALLLPAAVLLLAGARPRRSVAAAGASLVALGALSLLSPWWGGLPGEAWSGFDRALVAGAALALGSLLASWGGRHAVLAAVLAGVAALAVEVLLRLGLGEVPAEWFHGRVFQGFIGYHNGQAALFALAVPLALWAASLPGRVVSFLGGGCGAALVAATLLTQSRAGVSALAAALVVHVLATRNARLLATAASLAAAGAGLFLALRRVDAALLVGAEAEELAALRQYAVWSAAAAVAVGALAAVLPRRTLTRGRRAVPVAVAALLLGAGGVGAASAEAPAKIAAVVSELKSDEPPRTAPGVTRLATLTLNGRRDAWRVAAGMAAERPLLGAGQGRYASRWAVERRLTGLYVLQPHSLELELLAELGVAGLVALGAFLAFVGFALVSARDPAATAGLAVATVLVVQASVDWTWSFPGITAPALLALGAAAGGAVLQRTGPFVRAGVVLAAVTVVAALVLPFAADRALAEARASSRGDAERAWRYARLSARLNPWNPAAPAFQGWLAERSGAYRLAADRYATAAEKSQQPWVERFREARARGGGDVVRSRRACRLARAANPAEPLLKRGPCAA